MSDIKNQKKPVYLSIALDLANRILTGELPEGELVSGRSELAGYYNVSTETIRRSLSILENDGILEKIHGKGTKILSKSEAEQYVEKNKASEYLASIREDIVSLMEQRESIDQRMKADLNSLFDYLERFKNDSPYTFIEFKITEDANYLGRQIRDLRFWQRTGATLVAYRRDDQVIISPGPDYVFQAEDIIVVIGQDQLIDQLNEFFYQEDRK